MTLALKTVTLAFSVTGDVPFVVCYVLVRIVLITMYARAAYYIPLARPLSVQYAIGFSGASALLLISLLFATPVRYMIWGAAIVAELITPYVNLRAARLFPIDRSHLPAGDVLEQYDATGWMGFYAVAMGSMASVLNRSGRRPAQDLALKFLEHFAAITDALDGLGLWDDAHGLYYPEHMVWEDLQLMTRAHVLAKAVDVIPDYIYYWRGRAGRALDVDHDPARRQPGHPHQQQCAFLGGRFRLHRRTERHHPRRRV